MQIIGRLEGTEMMYLYGKLNKNLLSLGEAHRTPDGFWYFTEPYTELPGIAVYPVIGFIAKINKNGGYYEAGSA